MLYKCLPSWSDLKGLHNYQIEQYLTFKHGFKSLDEEKQFWFMEQGKDKFLFVLPGVLDFFFASNGDLDVKKGAVPDEVALSARECKKIFIFLTFTEAKN